MSEYISGGDGAFSNITDTVNARNSGYGVGCTVGDSDNDGHLDLYITNFGPNTCYQDNEDDTFTDVLTRASLANKQWRTSCALANIDTMLNIISSRSGM